MPTLTGPQGSYALNGWQVLNNVWNPKGFVYGQDYTLSTTFHAADPVNKTRFDWAFPSSPAAYANINVYAYPELLFGVSPWWGSTNPTDPLQVFPIRVSDIAALTADYSLSFDGETRGYNVSFEMWLTNTPAGGSATITNEIMVWFHDGAFGPDGAVVGTYTDQYFSGIIHNAPTYGDPAHPWEYTAIATTSDSLTGRLDIAAILRELKNLGIITGTEYLATVELGAELAVGQGSLTVNSLNYNIQTVNGTNIVIGGFRGTSGNDTFVGGPGIQTAVFSGARSAYTITRNGGTITITGPGGTDTLTSIEKIAFDDQTVLLGQGPMSADFNTDLNSDILLQNTSGQAGIWLMNGTNTTLEALVGDNPGTSWKAIGTGDFDGDGKADILWQNTSGQAGVWLMSGITVTSQALIGDNPGTSWKAIGTGDFDGDGKADILWQNTNGQAGIWLMNGATPTLEAIVGDNPGTSWKAIGTGDFDGDGKADILWQNDNGQAGVWLMNGNNVTSEALVGDNPGTNWKAVGAEDVNGDGKADILWQNTSGQAGVWLMSGISVLSQALVGSNPGSSWHIIAGTGG
jgi:hypothetical protein